MKTRKTSVDNTQIVSKLQNSLAERTARLEYANRQLTALAKASADFQRFHNEDELFEAVSKLLTRTLDFDRAALMIEKDGELTFRSSWYEKDTPELIDDFFHKTRNKEIPMPRAFLESFEENKVVFIPDLNSDPRWPKPEGEKFHTRAMVIAPVAVKGKPVGVIVGTMQYHEREMDTQDVARFETFCNMVGLALENIRAYQSLEREVMERTASYQKTNQELQQKAEELRQKTYSLAMANVDLLGLKEQLEEKNAQMEILLHELSLSKDELQAIIDASPDAIVMINKDNKITASNQRIYDYFGLKKQAVLNKRFSTFVEKIQPCFKDFGLFRKYAEEMEGICAECDFSRMDMRQIYAHSLQLLKPRERIIVPIPSLVRGKTGTILGKIWVYKDITAIKKADELLNTVVEASPIPSIVTRASDGKILYVNESLATLVGMNQAEMVGRKSPEFYADLKERDIVLAKLAKDGFLRNHEVRIRKADGSIIWMIFSLVTTELSGEKVVIGGLYDIDKRRQAEEALRESEERFRQLTENIREVFWIADTKDMKTIYISPAFEDIWGRKAESTDLTELIISSIHPDDRQNILKIMNQPITGESTVEYRIVRPDGELRWIREKAFPIFNETGALYRICGISEDITSHKLADEALKQERNFIATILDTAGALVVVLDTRGRIVRFNRACEQVTGYTFQEVQGKSFWDFFIIPEEIEKIRASFQELLSGVFPTEVENHWLTRDGERRLISWSNTSLLDNDGKVEYVIGTGIDVTDRRKAEENLRLYRKVFMNSNDMIAILDPSGKILEVNPAAVKVFGYSHEELKGQTTARLIGDEAFEQFLKKMPLQGNYDFRKELTASTRDGKRIDVELSTFPILNEQDEVIYRVGFSRDITQRKRAEEALRKAHDELEIRVQERTAELAEVNETLKASQARNTALLNAIPDLMFRLHRDGHYLDYKAPKDSDLALPEEAVIGKHISETLPPELAKQTRQKIHQALKSSDIQVMEYELQHEGHFHNFEARIVVSGSDEILAIVRDITQRKKAEAELRQAHEELELRVQQRTAELQRINQELIDTQTQLIQSAKMADLGQLVAGVAHEINTPVGAIGSMHNTTVRAVEKLKQLLEAGHPEILQENPRIGAALKVLEDGNRVIASGTERVTNIVKRLRSFARLDEAELKDANIEEGIEDTLMLIHHEIKHHITIVKKYGKLPLIACYPGKLNQVFLNLLNNARQALKGEGTITISTSHETGMVHVAIADDGIGIPPDNLKKVFDPGFTTKGVGIGTGLGLSICYRIVTEDHLGKISVESQLGKGTTFKVSIPDNLDELLENT